MNTRQLYMFTFLISKKNLLSPFTWLNPSIIRSSLCPRPLWHHSVSDVWEGGPQCRQSWVRLCLDVVSTVPYNPGYVPQSPIFSKGFPYLLRSWLLTPYSPLSNLSLRKVPARVVKDRHPSLTPKCIVNSLPLYRHTDLVSLRPCSVPSSRGHPGLSTVQPGRFDRTLSGSVVVSTRLRPLFLFLQLLSGNQLRHTSYVNNKIRETKKHTNIYKYYHLKIQSCFFFSGRVVDVKPTLTPGHWSSKRLSRLKPNGQCPLPIPEESLFLFLSE